MLVAIVLYMFFLEKNFSLENLLIVHLNHGTRLENMDEQQFVEGFFASILVVTATYKQKNHSEQAMRIWRYDQFCKICEAQRVEFLVLGHHLNDRVETTFLHMLRGCGLP